MPDDAYLYNPAKIIAKGRLTQYGTIDEGRMGPFYSINGRWIHGTELQSGDRPKRSLFDPTKIRIGFFLVTILICFIVFASIHKW